MVDPIAQNEMVKSLLDGYRIFLQEMQLIGQDKTALIKSVIARLDTEKIEEARQHLKNLSSYDRSRP